MSWEIVLQSFTIGLAGIGSWFLYDLVTEFKTFKTETKSDIISLKKERDEFKSTVRGAELSISFRVNELQALHTDFRATVNDALMKLNYECERINTKTKNIDEVLTNTIKLFRHYDREIKNIKIDLEKIMIFKTGK